MSRKESAGSRLYKGIRIRKRSASWQVDYGKPDGKRVQRSFSTKALAKRDINEHLAQETVRQKDVQDNGVCLQHLTRSQRIDVLEALDMLGGKASLRDVASFYLQHHTAPDASPAVREVLEEYRHAKRKMNCREWHLRTIDYRIGKFAETFGDTSIADITPAQIEGWLDGYQSNRRKSLGPVSRNNFLAYLNAFFNFAAKKGYASSNPVERIDRIRLDRPEIAILSPDEVRRLLFAARDHVPELMPYLAIAIFAGVRPAELQRLTWDRINFDLKYIHVTGGTAKVRGERYVDMENVLLKWLKPYRQKAGPICPQETYGFTKFFDKVRQVAGLKTSWKPDVLRHTYASYHVAKYERKDKTALMMGNSTKMLDRHYRRPLHRSHTTAFWSVSPQ